MGWLAGDITDMKCIYVHLLRGCSPNFLSYFCQCVLDARYIYILFRGRWNNSKEH